jgi:hypothetical protein
MLLSASAQIAASSNKKADVSNEVVDLVSVISKTLKALQAKLSLKFSNDSTFNISEVNNQPFHSKTDSLAVLN